MKKNKIFRKISFLGTIVFLTVILTSFNTKKLAPTISCKWYANASSISLVEVYNDCNGFATEGYISQGTTWQAALVHWCNYLTINTLVGSSHPAGTLTIYRNGVLIFSQFLPANSNIADETFEAHVRDQFEVFWSL